MFERNHQEFSYGASKIIFYMNEDTEIKEKKKLVNLPSMNKRRIQTKTTDLNHRVKRVCELAK